jgi:hypothetical protein
MGTSHALQVMSFIGDKSNEAFAATFKVATWAMNGSTLGCVQLFNTDVASGSRLARSGHCTMNIG